MLVVVLNPLCPVRLSLLLYCTYFCFSDPNKTISIRTNKPTNTREVIMLLLRGLAVIPGCDSMGAIARDVEQTVAGKL